MTDYSDRLLVFRNRENIVGTEWKNDQVLMFRTLQVYNQIYNNRWAVLWTYGMAAVFAIDVLCTSMSLRLSPHMPFPSNMMFPVGMLSLGYYSTRVYKATSIASDRSEDLAHKLKNSADPYKRRVGASMKSLRVEARPFFYMRKTTSFAFNIEVVDKTVMVLVSS